MKLKLLNELIKFMVRVKTPVNYSDLLTNKPISTVFGLDRGTAIDRYYIEKFYNENKDLISGSIFGSGG